MVVQETESNVCEILVLSNISVLYISFFAQKTDYQSYYGFNRFLKMSIYILLTVTLEELLDIADAIRPYMERVP